MMEMLDGVQAPQSYESVVKRIEGIKRWWSLTEDFLQQNSTPLGEAVLKIIAETQKGGIFPDGMDANWALDVQSAQTLDFLAAIQGSTGRIGWDLGTLTGISAAVLSQHMDVVTVEREPKLVDFARKHLPGNVQVVHSEILTFLEKRAAEGAKADFIFMDLDKSCYLPCYNLIMQYGLLAPGSMMLCDNVLYRGLAAQHQAGEMPEVSEKTAVNAAALSSFLARVGQDKDRGLVRSLMMPVRDGMLAFTMPQHDVPNPDAASGLPGSAAGAGLESCLGKLVADKDLLGVLSAIARSVVDIGVGLRQGSRGYGCKPVGTQNTFGDDQLAIDVTPD